jgi:hypothetical protein
MASPAVIAFHNEQMAQERERVRLRIANGTKASSNLVIGRRMQNPSYKGLPDNSTGSKIRPFFAMKDESHVPLEQKVAMRGGVLSTDAGMKFARAILRRRAEDTTNIDRMKEELPPVPPKLLELDEAESKSLELNTILDAVSDAADAGAVYGLPIGEISKIPRLFISLAPTFSEPQITDLITTIEDIVATLERNTPLGRSNKGPVRIADEEDAANQVSSTRVIVPLERSIRFLRGLLPIVNVANERDKRTAISILAKRVFAKILSKKQVDSAMAGAEVESREPEAELQRAPLDAAAEAEQGETPQQREQRLRAMLERRRQRAAAATAAARAAAAAAAAAEEEEEEEEAAPAAPAPAATRPFVPITQVAKQNLTIQPNYQEFLAYTRPYQLGRFDERNALMNKLGSLILAGATAQEAMQQMIDENWKPVVYRITRR